MLDLYVNIRKLREMLGMSQEELARLTGYTSRSSIAKIENGDVDLSQSKIILFAEALHTTPVKLMGWDKESNVESMITKMTHIPVIEYVSCGHGEYNDGQIIDYISIPSDMLNARKEYFAQYAKGDSMIGVGINDGDVLVFERTDVPEENRIGTFCIDNDYAICKRYRCQDGKIYLLSANEKYLPIVIDPMVCECFRTVGLLAFVLNDMREV